MTTRIRAQLLWDSELGNSLTAAATARSTGDTLIGYEDGTVRILDVHGKQVGKVASPSGPVTSICVVDHGLSFAAADPFAALLWNRSGRKLDEFSIRDTSCLALDRHSGQLFVGTKDKRLIRVGRRGASLIGQLGFDATHLQAGHRDWEVFAGSANGDLALYTEDLDLWWMLSLRSSSGKVASDVAGRFLAFPCHDLGVCAFEPDGSSLGVYETPVPAEHVAVAPGAARMAIGDTEGGLYLLTRERGLCVWREEPRQPLFHLALGPDRLVAIDVHGTVRCYGLGVEEASRGSFVELHHEAETPRREPTWSMDLPPVPGAFPGQLALSHDGRFLAVRLGATLTVWSLSGDRVMQAGGSFQGRPVWGQKQRLYCASPHGLSAMEVPRGTEWSWNGQFTSLAAGAQTDRVALVDEYSTLRMLDGKGGERWTMHLDQLPDPPTHVVGNEDLSLLGLIRQTSLGPRGNEGSFYLLSGEGKPLWKREVEPGSAVLLAGQYLYLATRDGRVSCYGAGEHRDWQTQIAWSVDCMFRAGDRAYLVTEDCRYFQLQPEGGLEPVDRHSQKGFSRLVQDREGQWREIHCRDNRLTCFDLEGHMLWTCQGLGPFDEATVTSAEAAVAFVAGGKLHFLSLDKDVVELPQTFLEL